jgi:hypothetical protein
MADDSTPIEISDWKPAPFAMAGETVFAVGDVHGCAHELKTLLSVIASTVADGTGPRRLIFLGGLIHRGAENMCVLKLWAEGEKAGGAITSTGSWATTIKSSCSEAMTGRMRRRPKPYGSPSALVKEKSGRKCARGRAIRKSR